MDCSPPGHSVLGISQARTLEWVAISFSRDLPDPGIWTRFSCVGKHSLPLSHQGRLPKKRRGKQGYSWSAWFAWEPVLRSLLTWPHVGCSQGSASSYHPRSSWESRADDHSHFVDEETKVSHDRVRNYSPSDLRLLVPYTVSQMLASVFSCPHSSVVRKDTCPACPPWLFNK